MNRLLLGTVLVATLVPFAAAEPIYRWLDDQGQAHFSDRPPPHGAETVEQLSAPVFAEPELSAEEDPYSILNQARRLEEARLQIERERQEERQRQREYELRQRELEARQRAASAPASGPVYVYPRPPYPRPRVHGPGWNPSPSQPWSLWKHDHPAYRPYPAPPLRPPRSTYLPGELEPRR